MKYKVILFDLDGTLLPMDQIVFAKTYFGLMAKKLANHGYNPEKLVESILIGTKAMVLNDSGKTNEEVFWDKMVEIYGEDIKKDIKNFDQFYIEDFDKVKVSSGYNELSPLVIKKLKEKGYRLVLATNPIFPKIATQKRMIWAGIEKEDFEFYTTYENSSHCKPNLKYYQDILNILKVNAEDCLMVGNDVGEDMVAEKLGINVFLLTDCLINKENKDISSYPQGTLQDLMKFLKI